MDAGNQQWVPQRVVSSKYSSSLSHISRQQDSVVLPDVAPGRSTKLQQVAQQSEYIGNIY